MPRLYRAALVWTRDERGANPLATFGQWIQGQGSVQKEVASPVRRIRRTDDPSAPDATHGVHFWFLSARWPQEPPCITDLFVADPEAAPDTRCVDTLPRLSFEGWSDVSQTMFGRGDAWEGIAPNTQR